MDSKVEESIGGGKTSFCDERAIEQRLVIDPLDLPGNEPVWIVRRGGAAGEVEPDHCLLAGIDFLGAMVVDLGVKICKHNKKKMREGEERAANRVGAKNEDPCGYL